jgi:uncharacterized protein YwgA
MQLEFAVLSRDCYYKIKFIKMTEQQLNTAGLIYLIKKAPDSGFRFRIRLQKMILLGKLEFGFPFTFTYESHFYGPYSAELQTLLSQVIDDGLIKEDVKIMPEGQFGYFYEITEIGDKILTDLQLPSNEVNKLDRLWEKYHNFDTNILVRHAKKVSGIKSINE